ncbi:hypothetical protein BDZ85DRAFT_76732 [Elsinoe ampelina]|uniref:STEEP1 domain-containing protein n=1 Tax=Elsinoe ampelina TaxID=302913 RepID=A0A6A6GKG5_9PEZI|nr:hypothetical protein BDZ85DRAFT_76732 [Elsinoe ampelina]
MPAEIHTYHCPCTSLLFASSTLLTSLPQRKLDSTTILPVTSSPTPISPTSNPHFATLYSKLEEHIFDPSPQDSHNPHATNGSSAEKRVKLDQSVKSEEALPKEFVASLEDGFEKRYLLRCGKCEAPWGYLLDWASWSRGEGKEGRREDVLYVLKGAVEETEEMGRG